MWDYRQYFRDILDDGFDITHVDDFDSWAREEYEMLQRCAEYEDAAPGR